MSSTEVIKKHLLDNVKELVINHGVSHKEIITDIHDEIIELSKTVPKFEVLYNNAYGGYGLSKEFISFVKHNQQERKGCINPYDYKYDITFRRQAVQYILPFGHYILEKYPILKTLLVIYHHCKLDDIVHVISSMYYIEDKLRTLCERRDDFEHCLAIEYIQGDKVIKKYTLDDTSSEDELESKEYYTNEETKYALIHYNHVDFEGYTKESYEELLISLNKEVEEIETKLKKDKTYCINDYNITETKFYEIKHIINNLMENNKSCSLYNKQDYNFIEALDKFGVDDNRTWKHQHRYSELTLQYLMTLFTECNLHEFNQEFNKNYIYDFAISNSYISVNDEDYDKIVNGFGLVCASSQYCALDIAEVPEYISWSIGEYDGLEQIVFQ
jgi:hypothetical protein